MLRKLQRVHAVVLLENWWITYILVYEFVQHTYVICSHYSRTAHSLCRLSTTAAAASQFAGALHHTKKHRHQPHGTWDCLCARTARDAPLRRFALANGKVWGLVQLGFHPRDLCAHRHFSWCACVCVRRAVAELYGLLSCTRSRSKLDKNQITEIVSENLFKSNWISVRRVRGWTWRPRRIQTHTNTHAHTQNIRESITHTHTSRDISMFYYANGEIMLNWIK